MTERGARPLLLFASMALLVGCALPTDEHAQVITDRDLAEVVNPTTTTATTIAGAKQLRTLHYIGENDRLIGQQRPLDSQLSIREILNTLAVALDDDDESTEELRNTVPPDFVIETAEVDDDGTLRIHLADDELLQVPGNDLTRAVAQIVITAMGLDSDIEAVRFFIEDEPQSVPAGEGENKSDPVDRCDYAQFLTEQDRVRYSCPAVSTS